VSACSSDDYPVVVRCAVLPSRSQCFPSYSRLRWERLSLNSCIWNM